MLNFVNPARALWGPISKARQARGNKANTGRQNRRMHRDACAISPCDARVQQTRYSGLLLDRGYLTMDAFADVRAFTLSAV
jgi:hypothetical protein